MGNIKMKIVIFTMLAAISTIIASSLRRNENKSKSDLSKLQHTCKIRCQQVAEKKSWNVFSNSSSEKGDLFIRRETKVLCVCRNEKRSKIRCAFDYNKDQSGPKETKRFLIYNGGFTKSERSNEKIQSWIFDGTLKPLK